MVIVLYLTLKFQGFTSPPKSPIVIDQRVLVWDHEFGRIEKKEFIRFVGVNTFDSQPYFEPSKRCVWFR